jgi:hypothetical protein
MMITLRHFNIFRTLCLEREAERLGIALVRQRAAVSNYAAMMERQAAPGELAELSARLISAEGEIETLDAGVYRASELLASGLAHEAAKELLDLLQRQIERHEQQREAS